MTLPQNVKDAVGNVDACRLETFDADWLTIKAHLTSQEAEIEQFRQSYWNARSVMGFDNDGDQSPRSVTSSFGEMMKSDAESMRRDYDESLRESDVVESRLAAANALLREIVGFRWFVTRAPFTTEEIQVHLQGAGDEGGRPA